MKKILSVMVCASLSLGAMAQEALAFDANAGVKSKMTIYDGTELSQVLAGAIHPLLLIKYMQRSIRE